MLILPFSTQTQWFACETERYNFIDRPEDLYERTKVQEQKSKKLRGGIYEEIDGVEVTGGKKKKRQAEIALSLGGDLDFSSDDSDSQ